MFVAVGVGAVLAFRVGSQPSRRSIALFLAFGLATSTSWAASYFVVAREQARSAPFYTSLGTWQGAFPPFEESWKMAYWLLDVHAGNMLAYPNGGNNFGSLATAILVAIGCLSLAEGLCPRSAGDAALAPGREPAGGVPPAALSLRHQPPRTTLQGSWLLPQRSALLAGVGLVGLDPPAEGASPAVAYRLATIAARR